MGHSHLQNCEAKRSLKNVRFNRRVKIFKLCTKNFNSLKEFLANLARIFKFKKIEINRKKIENFSHENDPVKVAF